MNPITKRLLALGASSVIAVTGGYMVAPWEGKENNAYKDIVGIPTICYGQTKDVKIGDYKTDAECDKDLADELTKYNKAMKKYVTVPLKEYEEVAYTSFIWNIGETNWRTSTLVKKLNSGDREGACTQLLRWNKAGGKVIKGLDNRRKDEYKVCMGQNANVQNALESLKSSGEESVDLDKGEGTKSIEKTSTEPLVQNDVDFKPREQIIIPKSCSFSIMGWCVFK